MPKGKAAVFVEPYHFEITELPTPEVEPGGALVKITAGGICGSDLHYWRGEMKPMLRGKPGPVILGHEMTGVIHSMGKDVSTDSMGQPLSEGDRVVFTYFFPCRRCYICLRGEPNHCPDRFRFRASVEEQPYCNGGFAEYYYLYPGHYVFKVPDELPDEAVTAVNCAVSQVIYGLQIGGARMGDSVVIQGAGGLGLYATAAARDMGVAQVITIDGIAPRLEMARLCGADHTIDINEYPTPEDRIERVKDLTGGWGADVCLELVGYPQVVAEGLQMLRHGGAFVEVGNIWAGSNVTLDVSKLIWGQTRIIPAAHYDPQILPAALDFLVRTKDKYPLTQVMSHKYPLEEIGKAFEQSEWLGKTEGTEITRAFVTP
jgi:L-iditol 2-dehydrogenase